MLELRRRGVALPERTVDDRRVVEEHRVLRAECERAAHRFPRLTIALARVQRPGERVVAIDVLARLQLLLGLREHLAHTPAMIQQEETPLAMICGRLPG